MYSSCSRTVLSTVCSGSVPVRPPAWKTSKQRKHLDWQRWRLRCKSYDFISLWPSACTRAVCSRVRRGQGKDSAKWLSATGKSVKVPQGLGHRIKSIVVCKLKNQRPQLETFSCGSVWYHILASKGAAERNQHLLQLNWRWRIKRDATQAGCIFLHTWW